MYYNSSNTKKPFYYRNPCQNTWDEYFRLNRVGINIPIHSENGALQPTYTIQAAIEGKCWSRAGVRATRDWIDQWDSGDRLQECSAMVKDAWRQQFAVWYSPLQAAWRVTFNADDWPTGSACLYAETDGRFNFGGCYGKWSDAFWQIESVIAGEAALRWQTDML